MLDTPIRVGVVGYGFVSKLFHIPMIQATPAMRLIAISSSRPDNVVADLPDVNVVPTAEDLIALNDVDLVVIASPNPTHRPLAEAALNAGKHVLVDKPFVLSLDEARSVLETARKAGKIVSVFQNRRWDSDFLGIKSVIESGRVGRVAHLESRLIRFAPVPGEQWRDADGAGSGVWFDLAPHMVDQIVQLFGLPDRVSAEIGALRDGARTDDWFEVILRYPSHFVSLLGSRIAAASVARFVLHGHKGSVVKAEADLQEDRFKEGVSPDAPDVGDDPDDMIVFDGYGGQERLATPNGRQLDIYHALAKAILGQAPNPVLPREALAVMAIIEAARRASESGKAAELSLTQAEFAEWPEHS